MFALFLVLICWCCRCEDDFVDRVSRLFERPDSLLDFRKLGSLLSLLVRCFPALGAWLRPRLLLLHEHVFEVVCASLALLGALG